MAQVLGPLITNEIYPLQSVILSINQAITQHLYINSRACCKPKTPGKKHQASNKGEF